MTGKEIVIEKQIFLHEAFLDSLRWGYGTVNTGTSLEDFLFLTSDLPKPQVEASQKRINIEITFKKRLSESQKALRDVCVVTNKVEFKQSDRREFYMPTDYIAIIERSGDIMQPMYTVKIRTTRSSTEVKRIQDRLFGTQTKMVIPRRIRNTRTKESLAAPLEDIQLPLLSAGVKILL